MLRLYLRHINAIFRLVRPVSKQSSKFITRFKTDFLNGLPKRRIGHGVFVAFSFFFWNSKNDKEVNINDKQPFKKIVLIIKKGKLKEFNKDYDEAEKLYHQALQTLYQHPLETLNQLEVSQTKSYIFDCLANLALLQNDLSRAEMLYKETLKELLIQKFDKDDNAIIEISLKLSMIYAAQEKYDDAKIGYLFCIDSIEKKMLKLEDYLTQADENSLALYGMVCEAYSRFLNRRGKWKESLPFLEKALLIVGKVYVDAHPQVAVISNDLGVTKQHLNEDQMALQHFQYAVDIGKQCNSPDLPVILYNMGEVLKKMNKLDKSSKAFKSALESCSEGTSDEIRNKILDALDSLESATRLNIGGGEFLLIKDEAS